MELLKQRIREEGIVLNNRVLKVKQSVKKLLIVTVKQGYNVLLLLRHLALHWH